MLPDLQGTEQILEFGAWAMLSAGGICVAALVAALWLGRLLGYIEKGDTLADLIDSVAAMAPYWFAKVFLRNRLEGGPKTEARIRYAARAEKHRRRRGTASNVHPTEQKIQTRRRLDMGFARLGRRLDAKCACF